MLNLNFSGFISCLTLIIYSDIQKMIINVCSSNTTGSAMRMFLRTKVLHG